MSEYAYSFKLHGDGEPLLFYYYDSTISFCYVVMKSDIAEYDKFDGLIEKGRYFDLETPYGYGGPLCDGIVSDESQKQFELELVEYCRVNGIVSQFVRFHPLLQNENILHSVFDIRYMRDTIYIDTESADLIMTNMDSKNRNMVRKAKKNDVSIVCKPISDYCDFKSLYLETMKKDNAGKYYFFDDKYFEAQKLLHDNACIFYAMKEERTIAGAIIYYNERFAHYHLSGSHADYRKYSPSNLLLYEVACWASERGIRNFHLGGGMSPEDSLFGFKKQFNKKGRLPFYIGRTVFDQEKYDYLVGLRKKSDSSFDADNNRMIQYRF